MVDKYYFIKGGAERYYFELKKVLEANGHDVIPFSMKHPRNYTTEYNDYFVDNIEFNYTSHVKRAANSLKIAGRIIYSLHAKKQIEADTIEEAFRQFSQQFDRLVDRIAFIGQCHTTADLETFIIAKPDDNRFFWRYAKKRGPVPLHFNDDEVRSLATLDQFEEKGDVFR